MRAEGGMHMLVIERTESVQAFTLRELLFTRIEGRLIFHDGPLKPRYVYHVPGEEVTYTADDLGDCWVGEGHARISYVYETNAPIPQAIAA